MRLRPGLRLGPHRGSLQRSPRPLAGIQGAASRNGTGGEGSVPPLLFFFLQFNRWFYWIWTGTTVLRVNATDLDIQQNALIRYRLGPGGRDNFYIDPNDGSIYVSPYSDLAVDNPPTYYNITVGTCRSFARAGCSRVVRFCFSMIFTRATLC